MHDFLMWVGGIIATGLFSVIGWVIKMIFGKIENIHRKYDGLEDRFDAHRLYAAETFTTKTDIREMRNEIISEIRSIGVKLDKKADKQ